MTQEAAEAVAAIVDRPDLPDTAVLRITKQPTSANGAAPTLDLQLELVSEAPPDDVVVEDLPISVQPEAASFLEDKVLDAEFDDEGVRFSLYGRPDSPA
jgi:iron-sulfur cluster assembly protein